jgi:nitroreductase
MQDIIFTRVSIRKYKDRPVEEEKLDRLLRAAMQAPSAGNQQPWEFYVVTNKEKLAALAQASPFAGCTKDAPAAIVICSRTKQIRWLDYAEIDCSIACENIWLEAEQLGLGTVWLGIAPLKGRMDTVREILAIPEDLNAFAIMPVGYPDETRPQQDRYDASRIHRAD